MGASYCYVTGCNTRSGKKSKEEKVGLFKPPSSTHVYAQWKTAVQRKDVPFSYGIKVCGKHFEEQCINKGVYSNGPDGRRILVKENKKYTLVHGAVPTLHLGKKHCASLTVQNEKRRKRQCSNKALPDDVNNYSLQSTDSIATLPMDEEMSDISVGDHNQSPPSSAHLESEPNLSINEKENAGSSLPQHRLPIEGFEKLFTSVALPQDWRVLADDQLFFKMVVLPCKIVLLKSVKVDPNGSVQYYIRGKPCHPDFLMESFGTVKELSDIIKNFDSTPLCPGCPEEELRLLKPDCTSVGVLKKKAWRSKTCELIACPGQIRCDCCSTLKKILVKKKTMDRDRKEAAKLKKSRIQVRNEVKKNRRLNSKVKALKEEIFATRKKVNEKAHQLLANRLDQLDPKV